MTIQNIALLSILWFQLLIEIIYCSTLPYCDFSNGPQINVVQHVKFREIWIATLVSLNHTIRTKDGPKIGKGDRDKLIIFKFARTRLHLILHFHIITNDTQVSWVNLIESMTET